MFPLQNVISRYFSSRVVSFLDTSAIGIISPETKFKKRVNLLAQQEVHKTEVGDTVLL
jgi:hypothetical protein